MASDRGDALRAEAGSVAAAAAHACEGAVRRWENRIAGRYYEARLVRDLFGDWQVMRVWGGIGTARGAARFHPLAGPGAFPGELERIDKRRLQRGYLPRP